MLIRPAGLLGSSEWGFLRPDRVIQRLKRPPAAAPVASEGERKEHT
jgi:hypothetical protein